MRIWTITATGVRPRTMETCGSRELLVRIGLPTTTVIGLISNLGAIRGWMTSHGDSHLSTMDGGSTTTEPGAGCLGHRVPKELRTCARFTRPRSWLGSEGGRPMQQSLGSR